MKSTCSGTSPANLKKVLTTPKMAGFPKLPVRSAAGKSSVGEQTARHVLRVTMSPCSGLLLANLKQVSTPQEVVGFSKLPVNSLPRGCKTRPRIAQPWGRQREPVTGPLSAAQNSVAG